MRTLIAMLATAALTVSVAAGNLDPPGAPAPTPGPEPRTAINLENTPGDSDSLYRITSPGSYYLTGNIIFSTAKNAIEIGADNVTLDLNGFTLGRGIFMDQPLSGIVADSGVENVTVRNGVVQGFSLTGVDLFNARNTLVDQIIVSGNGDDGMRTGVNGVVTRCVAEGNGGVGILAGTGSTVSDCTALENIGDGIFLSGQATARGCVSNGNGGFGIGTSSRCSVIDCTVADNADMGIGTNSFSTVRGCTVHNNTGSGISVSGGRCLIFENICTSNGDGDDAGIVIFNFANSVGNRIEGNNVVLNDNMGIDVNHGGNLIIRNSASENGVNYSIVGGNTVGPIIGVSNPIISTNPWANFLF